MSTPKNSKKTQKNKPPNLQVMLENKGPDHFSWLKFNKTIKISIY